MPRSIPLACLLAVAAPGCLYLGPPPWACGDTEQACAGGEVCVDGACKQLCQRAVDCPGEMACAQGYCEPYAQECGDQSACTEGFLCDGSRCRKLIGECHLEVPNSCGPDATCVGGASGPVCLCNDGFAWDGAGCADVDECTAGTYECGARVCLNTQGGYACVCPPGYVESSAGSCVSRWLAVTAGELHGCGIRGDGSLWCWGNNESGQLGVGARVSSARPIQVGHDADWQLISAGASHTCGVKQDGRLYCWGRGVRGRLGLGVTPGSDVPAQVGSGSWRSVGAGDEFTCGVQTNGSLWCWGANDSVQLGRAGDDAYSPVSVDSARQWLDVVAGAAHACARASDERLYCWGRNIDGQVGVGYVSESVGVPTAVPPAASWRRVGAGARHTCGIKADDSMWCWGASDDGRLGTGMSASSSPRQVEGSWETVAVGAAHACATNNARETRCFGDNAFGQLGLGTLTDVHVPTPLSEGGWTQLAAGGRHTCGIMPTGALHCFGENDQGQLGDGTGAAQPGFVEAGVAVGPWGEVAVGGTHACGVDGAGALWCWGNNTSLQLGASGERAEAPAQVGMNDGWSAIAAGDRHTCALRDGQLYCFGANEAGQAGVAGGGASVATPSLVDGESDWLAVSAGEAYGCGLREVSAGAGTLWCWGKNDAGQLGRGAGALGVDDAAPVRVGDAQTWRAVSAGARHTCAIQGGALWCFGDNTSGQLGEASAGSVAPAPLRVGADDDWRAIAAGREGTCGVRAPGTLWCWGTVGRQAFGSRPQLADGASDWLAVTLADEHACARKSGGSVWCFGANGFGQLGDGTLLARTSWAQVLGAAGYSALAVGGSASCAVRQGTLLCWGADGWGQRGDGRGWLPRLVLEP